jgi:ribonuclease BN (tRNA processing enzyme)
MSEILILGNGGAISEGLDYNSFLIDRSCLCEVPPDIMNSLYRSKADLSLIDTVFISHFHGDHCFGLPFLLLSFLVMGDKAPAAIEIVAPAGIRSLAFSLTETAFTKEHPCLPWMEKHLFLIFPRVSGSIGNCVEKII